MKIVLTKEEQVPIDAIYGHGGLLKTPEVGQKILSAAVDAPISVMEQAIAIFAGNQGYLDDIPVDQVVRFRTEILQNLRSSAPQIFAELEKESKFTDKIEADAKAAIERFKSQFAVS